MQKALVWKIKHDETSVDADFDALWVREAHFSKFTVATVRRLIKERQTQPKYFIQYNFPLINKSKQDSSVGFSSFEEAKHRVRTKWDIFASTFAIEDEESKTTEMFKKLHKCRNERIYQLKQINEFKKSIEKLRKDTLIELEQLKNNPEKNYDKMLEVNATLSALKQIYPL